MVPILKCHITMIHGWRQSIEHHKQLSLQPTHILRFHVDIDNSQKCFASSVSRCRPVSSLGFVMHLAFHQVFHVFQNSLHGYRGRMILEYKHPKGQLRLPVRYVTFLDQSSAELGLRAENTYRNSKI